MLCGGYVPPRRRRLDASLSQHERRAIWRERMVEELQSTPSLGSRSFEELKRINEHGAEYWSARDLQTLLGYEQWRRFGEAIQRARTSCEQSGNPTENQFAGAGKMVTLGSGSRREIADFFLSRFVVPAQRGHT